MPPIMLKAVNEYKNEMDVISSFISSCCIEGEGTVKASVLYSVYSKWADSNNEYKMSSTKFGIEISKRFEKYKTGGCMYYKSLSLCNDNLYSISIG